MPLFVEKSADNYCRFILKVLEDYYPEENKFLAKGICRNASIARYRYNYF